LDVSLHSILDKLTSTLTWLPGA